MSGRIITVDVAHAMAAKWKGYDGPYGVSWDDDGDCVIHYDDITIARVAHFDNGHTEALAHLFAVAPDDVKELSATVVAQAAEIERLRASLDRAHHALREWGPGCEHPGCNNLAPLRCEDCGARFCDDHDGGSAGHDSGVATPMPHAVGPDDLMAGVAIREAQVAR